jgi:outer membrane protein
MANKHEDQNRIGVVTENLQNCNRTVKPVNLLSGKHFQQGESIMFRSIVTLLFLSLVISGQAIAAPAAKVGVVDLQRAVSECKEGMAARADVQKKAEQYNSELKAKLADIEKMRTELEKNTDRLSADDRASREKLLQKKIREFQNRQQEVKEDLKQIESEYLKKIINKFGALIGKIGDDGKFSAILDRSSGVLYFGKETDITAQLVQLADADYSKR